MHTWEITANQVVLSLAMWPKLYVSTTSDLPFAADSSSSKGLTVILRRKQIL
jgi:hypothetical protein